MATCIHRFMRDESGLVITAELIMIITIAVISLTAGWGAVSAMLAEELEDVANSVGSLDQSYNYRGISAPGHASCSGSGFNDSRNSVNVSTSSNFNAQTNFDVSVAGGGFVQQGFALADAQVGIAGEPFVLIEEEFGVNVQIDEGLLLIFEQLGIVEIREDGAVILLREDLIEIQGDGTFLIIDEELRLRVEEMQLRQTQSLEQSDGKVRARGELTDQMNRSDIDAARKELNALRKEVESAMSGNNSNELSQENLRLRELIERLCKESQNR